MSDVSRLLSTFRLLHRSAGRDEFDFDFISKVLTENLQASSRGAVGSAALKRSHEEDRTRDPLFNQSKMYSEIFRMLGWLRPTTRRDRFASTLFGDLIAEDLLAHGALAYGLIRECLLGITFPNPSTDNVGVVNQRPFRLLLCAAAELGNAITRHEMAIAVLDVIDDLDGDAVQAALDAVRTVRGADFKRLDAVLERTARMAKVQSNTLLNYTRFPVGVMKSAEVGWGEGQRVPGLYKKPVPAIVLTQLGAATAQFAAHAVDVREEMLSGYDLEERAHFANYGYYSMLARGGFERRQIGNELEAASRGSARILTDLCIAGPDSLIYSPLQQADARVIEAAMALAR